MRNVIKDHLERGVRYLIYLIGGGGLCTLISIFALIPIRMFTGFIWELILTTIVQAVIMSVIIFYKGFKVGHREGECKAGRVVVSMIIAAVLHLLYSAVFRFAMWTAPPSFYLADLIYCMKSGVREITVFPDIYKFSTLWIFNALYIFAAILGEKLGAKKRLRERQRLVGKQ